MRQQKKTRRLLPRRSRKHICEYSTVHDEDGPRIILTKGEATTVKHEHGDNKFQEKNINITWFYIYQLPIKVSVILSADYG